MAGNLKPDITQSDVFNGNYFLLRRIKVAKELLMFLASLPEDSHFCPASHQRPVPGREGWGWEAPMAAKTGLPPIQREHREQSGFDQPLSWENMEGDRNIKCIVLLGCTCTKNWFLEYITTIPCRSSYCSCLWAWWSIIWYYLITKMSSRAYTKFCPRTNEERQTFILEQTF